MKLAVWIIAGIVLTVGLTYKLKPQYLSTPYFMLSQIGGVPAPKAENLIPNSDENIFVLGFSSPDITVIDGFIDIMKQGIPLEKHINKVNESTEKIVSDMLKKPVKTVANNRKTQQFDKFLASLEKNRDSFSMKSKLILGATHDSNETPDFKNKLSFIKVFPMYGIFKAKFGFSSQLIWLPPGGTKDILLTAIKAYVKTLPDNEKLSALLTELDTTQLERVWLGAVPGIKITAAKLPELPIYLTLADSDTIIMSTSEKMLKRIVGNALTGPRDASTASLITSIQNNNLVKSLNVSKVMQALGPMAGMASAMLGGLKRVDLAAKLDQIMQASLKGEFGSPAEANAGKIKLMSMVGRVFNSKGLEDLMPKVSVQGNSLVASYSTQYSELLKKFSDQWKKEKDNSVKSWQMAAGAQKMLKSGQYKLKPYRDIKVSAKDLKQLERLKKYYEGKKMDLPFPSGTWLRRRTPINVNIQGKNMKPKIIGFMGGCDSDAVEFKLVGRTKKGEEALSARPLYSSEAYSGLSKFPENTSDFKAFQIQGSNYRQISLEIREPAGQKVLCQFSQAPFLLVH